MFGSYPMVMTRLQLKLTKNIYGKTYIRSYIYKVHQITHQLTIVSGNDETRFGASQLLKISDHGTSHRFGIHHTKSL